METITTYEAIKQLLEIKTLLWGYNDAIDFAITAIKERAEKK